MKASLFGSWILGLVVGLLSGVLLGQSHVKTVEVPSKPRQFVILVTPQGPVFGEAKENEDIMDLLREAPAPKKESAKIPSPDDKGTITF